MLHNEEYDDAEYVYEISAIKLFKQVNEEGKPFHRWYHWLEERFSDLRDAYRRKDTIDNKSDLLKWQQAADKDEEKARERQKPKKKGLLERMFGRKKDAKELENENGESINDAGQPFEVPANRPKSTTSASGAKGFWFGANKKEETKKDKHAEILESAEKNRKLIEESKAGVGEF